VETDEECWQLVFGFEHAQMHMQMLGGVVETAGEHEQMGV
jgi:hypothetical protein